MSRYITSTVILVCKLGHNGGVLGARDAASLVCVCGKHMGGLTNAARKKERQRAPCGENGIGLSQVQMRGTATVAS